MDAARYSARERLRNGAEIEIRALVPADRTEMLAAFDRTSAETRYRRFFAPKNQFSEAELEFFLDVDFIKHVALAAVLTEGGRDTIVGGARYVVSQPGQAEVAFAVDDVHQKLGIGGRLMTHLVAIARASGLQTLVAEVLSENLPMLRVFERCGLEMTAQRDRGVVRVTLALSGAAK